MDSHDLRENKQGSDVTTLNTVTELADELVSAGLPGRI